jgi:hypothetical protein
MAITTRKMSDEILYALVEANNQAHTDALASLFHLDRTSTTDGRDYKDPTVTRVTVTHAAATNAATRITLVNQIKDVLDVHFTDAIAHNTATSAVITIADATDTTSAVALVNDLKAKLNTHHTAANVHYTNDGTNTVTNADATDATTLETLVNEVRTDVIAHVASAPGGLFINLVDA